MWMSRFLVMGGLVVFAVAVGAAEPAAKRAQPGAPAGAAADEQPVRKTDAQWRKLLSAQQYEVARKKGTEQPFTGAYWNHKKSGLYTCVCCGAPLFSSETKFESGTGWPSYWDPVAPARVKLEPDRSHGMERIEVQCRRCGAHLGHVFDDGPQPTGKRYCINSVCLDFTEQKSAAKKPPSPTKDGK